MMQELNYIRCGDYYIPDIRLPEETRPIGRWGRMYSSWDTSVKSSTDWDVVQPIKEDGVCLQ